MYRDGKQVLTSHVHSFILNHGALGDVICSLPAIVNARQRVSDIVAMKVYCPPWQAELLEHLLAPYGKFTVRSIAEFPLERAKREDWDGGPNSLNAAVHNTHTRNRVHMVDYAFNYLLDARPENMLERSYPTAAPIGPRYPLLDEPYVVIPVGATSDNKLFKAHVMGPIIQWLADNDLTPVLVGTKVSHTQAEMGSGVTEKLVIRDEIEKLPAEVVALCVDLREKTTLLELRDLCGHAEAVVGVDGGTLHLAGTTDTNIVYAMGTTLPKHRYIARGGDPNHKIRYVGPRDLECAGCQSNWALSRWDFRFCAYGDNKCMDQLHPDDFINGLKELLWPKQTPLL